jgi:HK97 family phage major capsid protein
MRDAITAQNGEMTQEMRNNWEALNIRMSEMETRAARPHAGPQHRDDAPPSAARAAFDKLLRRGQQSLTPDEHRTLIVGDDTAGGYLAPPEFANEVIKAVTLVSPIRSIARVIAISGRSLQIPTRTGTPTAYWLNEAASVTASNASYGMKDIAPHTLMAESRISRDLLEDAKVNVEQEIITDISEQFAAAEGAAFVAGNAVERPEGYTVNATILANYVASGNASLLTADGLVDLLMALKTVYAQRANWTMNRSTLAAIRKLKDGQGQYLWQPNYGQGLPPEILGVRYVETPDMPNVGTNTYAVAVGDFMRGYRIVDRVEMSIIRDDVTLASSGLVKFVARRRVGGAVTQAEAIKIQKVAAS